MDQLIEESLNEKIELSKIKSKDEHVNTVNSPFEGLTDKKRQISYLHKRSFADDVISNNVLWEDEFGNKLMAVDTKGQPPEGQMPFLEEDPYSKKGLRTHWLCDSTDVENTVKVSKVMRENGLATERIRKKSKLLELEVEGVMISIDEFKKRLLSSGFTSEYMRYEDVIKYVNETDFYVIERDMPIDERLSDLSIADSKVTNFCARFKNGEIVYGENLFSSITEFEKYIEGSGNTAGKKILERLQNNPDIFGIIDTGEKIKEILQPAFTYLKLTEHLDLDVNKDEDIKRFVTEILPQKMGEYLGRFHQMGLKHTYPGDKNWILIGALVDLDSVHGVPLDESSPTDKDIEDDLNQTLSAIQYIYMQSAAPIELSFKDKNQARQYSQQIYSGYLWSIFGDDPQFVRSQSDNALGILLKSYMQERNVSIDYLIEHTDPDVVPDLNVLLGK